jgi:hypothetical protein
MSPDYMLTVLAAGLQTLAHCLDVFLALTLGMRLLSVVSADLCVCGHSMSNFPQRVTTNL